MANRLLDINVQVVRLYCIAAVLVCYNWVFLVLVNRAVRNKRSDLAGFINKIVNLQISVDLIVLTIMLHFSGGVENPCVIFFIFHMVISSILLSTKESYLQATLAVGLITLLALLEYKNLIPHYCLVGFIMRDLHGDGLHIAGGLFIFAMTLYMIVYMTGTVATQLRKQEDAFRQANIQLEQKDRLKDEYVSRVTHDIKGHLAAIHSCLEVVDSRMVGPLNEKQQEFVQRAYARTCKLADFVRTLLKLTQMRLNDKFDREVFVLSEMIDSAVASVKTRAGDKSITLSHSFEPMVDKIYGNHFSIEEMVVNLLLNAIKYTPEHGTVTLNVIDQQEDILIEIVDTGIGIPESELEFVFDEFYRASNARKSECDGTGLGLSIAKQIVQRHCGKISVESKLGQGTRLAFTLPKGGCAKTATHSL
ncbi:MAG: HAMP domain-containing histidine kinase [Planctomycetes bacterium]|nr:HAMP domain-containing histidine kinase [Planctomycetota bacterium]